ncbi:MAG: hypothetical protein ACR2QA_01865 [Solirubrobacteraceae bacterium]
MQPKHIPALSGATAVAVLSLSGAVSAAQTTPAGGTTVTVRIEGRMHTLLAPTKVHTHAGSITTSGAPRGACPATSAAGALDVATHHGFSGPFSASLKDYFITRILGELESGKTYFWEIFADNVPAQTGACEIKLHSGEQLLFAAVPTKGTEHPTALSGPNRARAGHPFAVRLMFFDAKGRSKPLAGGRVYGAGVSSVTNHRGIARIVEPHAGSLVLHATPSGYIRAAPVRVRVIR